MIAPLLALALGCGPGDEVEPVDVGEDAEALPLPDLEGMDLPGAFEEALAVTAELRAALAWGGHEAALSLGREGCPDVYIGSPGEDVDADEGGVSWADYCSTSGGLGFSGFVWWDGEVTVEGEAGTPEGAESSGERRMIADGTVADSDGTRFQLDGEVSDALYRVDAEGYERWTWSSLLQGTLTGAEVFDGTATPGGVRADLYLYATGGDVDSLEARGDVYLFEEPVLGLFDSLSMDLAMVEEGSAGPGDCALEPRGYLSLRDTDAYWYDLVFLPRYDDDATDEDYENDPYGDCDGCGTLYVRGIEQGELCPDLSAIWDGRLDPPEVEDFVTSLRQVLEAR
jgi:hypothetical protein